MSEPEITAAELCRELKIQRRSLTRYMEAGCPHRRAGNGPRAPLRFVLSKVKAWMRQTARTGEPGRPPTGAEVRRSPAKARAEAPADKATDDLDDEDADDLAELTRRVNLQIKRLEVRKRERLEREANGELVEAAEVVRLWRSQIEVVQTSFRSLPGILAQRLVHCDYDTIYEALEEELHAVLVAFSETSLGELAT